MAYTFKYGDRPLTGITIQRAVGRGGFGEVYYAVSDSGKQLALKFLRENPEVELRGVAHVMNLKSPHLITIYDVRKDQENGPWVVMEYVSGPSLRDILNNEPNGLGPAKTAFFIEGIAAGLSYLHERGVVHRDLKPGNIFYDDGYVKIGDYGLSKHMSVSQHSGNTISVGTVHYMAPEIGSGNYTKAIDIYALGVMMYEMLTGKLPFAGSSMGEILMRHLSERPDLSAVPEPFRSVIAKALAKDPAQRYQDVHEMVDIIKAATDFRAGSSTFDPRTLISVPRNLNVPSAERTLTSAPLPPIPPLPLDVRDAEADAGQFRGAFGKRVDRLKRKLERKVEKLERKHGPGARPVQAPLSDGPLKPRRRAVRAFAMLTVAVGLAIALSFTSDSLERRQAESIFATAFFLLGGTIGALITYFKLLNRDDTESNLFDRLAYASVSALFMLPGLAAASDVSGGDFMKLMAVPLVVMVLCDWTQRIDDGRSGRVGGWDMFWPAVIGFIAANIMDVEQFRWTAAGLGGGLSLLTQCAASLWPISNSRASEPVQLGAAEWSRPLPAARGMFGRRTGCGVFGRSPAPVPVAPAPLPPAPHLPSSPSPSQTADRSARPPWRTSVAAPDVIELERPSFLTRTTNGGLAFVGMCVLLVSVLLAAFYHTPPAVIRDGGTTVEVSARAVRIQEGNDDINLRIPPPAIVAGVVVGGFLLALARRHDGGMHFFRGFVGTAVAMAGSVYLLGPGGAAFSEFVTGMDWQNLSDRETARIATLGSVAGLAAALLLWPRARRRVRVI